MRLIGAGRDGLGASPAAAANSAAALAGAVTTVATFASDGKAAGGGGGLSALRMQSRRLSESELAISDSGYALR